MFKNVFKKDVFKKDVFYNDAMNKEINKDVDKKKAVKKETVDTLMDNNIKVVRPDFELDRAVRAVLYDEVRIVVKKDNNKFYYLDPRCINTHELPKTNHVGDVTDALIETEEVDSGTSLNKILKYIGDGKPVVVRRGGDAQGEEYLSGILTVSDIAKIKLKASEDNTNAS